MFCKCFMMFDWCWGIVRLYWLFCLLISRCHRLNASGAFISISQFASQFHGARDQHSCNSQGHTPAEVLFSNALQSWTYPQSPLPPSVISAMTLSAARGGQSSQHSEYWMTWMIQAFILWWSLKLGLLLSFVETDFLSKRQLAWEDSFRSLYYLLRKSMCDIFYCNGHHLHHSKSFDNIINVK